MKIRHMIMSPDDGAGAGGGKTPPNDPNPKDKVEDKNLPKTVPQEDFDKVKNEASVFKTKATELETKLNALTEQITNDKKKSIEDKGDFKSLYETVKGEKEALQTKYSDFQKTVFNSEKLKSLETELKKRGLKVGSEAITDMADLSKMPHELTTMGRILVHGVEEVANDLEKKYGFAFSKGNPPVINGGGGGDGGGGEDLTPQYMVELETKDPKKYRELLPQYLKVRKQKLQGG